MELAGCGGTSTMCGQGCNPDPSDAEVLAQGAERNGARCVACSVLLGQVQGEVPPGRDRGSNGQETARPKWVAPTGSAAQNKRSKASIAASPRMAFCSTARAPKAWRSNTYDMVLYTTAPRPSRLRKPNMKSLYNRRSNCSCRRPTRKADQKNTNRPQRMHICSESGQRSKTTR